MLQQQRISYGMEADQFQSFSRLSKLWTNPVQVVDPREIQRLNSPPFSSLPIPSPIKKRKKKKEWRWRRGIKTETKNTHIIYMEWDALLFPSTKHAWTQEIANVQKWMQLALYFFQPRNINGQKKLQMFRSGCSLSCFVTNCANIVRLLKHLL